MSISGMIASNTQRNLKICYCKGLIPNHFLRYFLMNQGMRNRSFNLCFLHVLSIIFPIKDIHDPEVITFSNSHPFPIRIV
jgi:hypothetical protein